jgi:hypothetical protein
MTAISSQESAIRKFVVAALVVLASAAFAQDKKITVADFVGTWNIEVMSHQVALVIEAGEANSATGTMMMMGRDVMLKGELADRTITFIGVKTEGGGNAAANPDHAALHAGQATPKPQPIKVTLQEDGTLSGEMMTNNGPVTWTGEKLRARKKG